MYIYLNFNILENVRNNLIFSEVGMSEHDFICLFFSLFKQ